MADSSPSPSEIQKMRNELRKWNKLTRQTPTSADRFVEAGSAKPAADFADDFQGEVDLHQGSDDEAAAQPAAPETVARIEQLQIKLTQTNKDLEKRKQELRADMETQAELRSLNEWWRKQPEHIKKNVVRVDAVVPMLAQMRKENDALAQENAALKAQLSSTFAGRVGGLIKRFIWGGSCTKRPSSNETIRTSSPGDDQRPTKRRKVMLVEERDPPPRVAFDASEAPTD